MPKSSAPKRARHKTYFYPARLRYLYSRYTPVWSPPLWLLLVSCKYSPGAPLSVRGGPVSTVVACVVVRNVPILYAVSDSLFIRATVRSTQLTNE